MGKRIYEDDSCDWASQPRAVYTGEAIEAELDELLPVYCCAKCVHYRRTHRRRGLCSYLVVEITRPDGQQIDRHVSVLRDDFCGEYLENDRKADSKG